ncbi:hypothetical protein HPB48_026150 [Haemaphysalis longicornis]|uniref:Uncharacterized protein n=1 Tax=Haemaphysalis longicornis TaxID=44386 RepID=A0A9J6HBP8_HAELO|nr:hypothetical protein HPB48_026150 [Haemaphysalis longicornis]
MKRALDLPITTSSAKLLALGVVNTYRELREAHLTSQYTRLAQTESGRRLLNRIHVQHNHCTEGREGYVKTDRRCGDTSYWKVSAALVGEGHVQRELPQATGAAAPDRFSRDPPSPSGGPSAYRTLLPTIPTGKLSENASFLHGDPSARSYGVEDFASALKNITDLRAIECLSAPFSTTTEGDCLDINPSQREVAVKVHWLPPRVPDELIVRQLERFGRMQRVKRDGWRKPGLAHMTGTSRVYHIIPSSPTSLEDIPHQATVQGCPILIEDAVVPFVPLLRPRPRTLHGLVRRQSQAASVRTASAGGIHGRGRHGGHDEQRRSRSSRFQCNANRRVQPAPLYISPAGLRVPAAEECSNPEEVREATGEERE